MEKISKDTQPIEIYQTIEPDQVQEPEVSDLTRKEILEYIEEFAGS